MQLTGRLRRVEGNILRLRPKASSISLFWDDELEPCEEHARCLVEPESGSHHAGVIRLSFDSPDLPRRTSQ